MTNGRLSQSKSDCCRWCRGLIVCLFIGSRPHFLLHRGIQALSLNKEWTQSGSDGMQNSQGLRSVLQTNTSVSPKSLVSGGKQAASDGTLPWFSLSPPTAGRHGGKGRERVAGREGVTEEERQRGASRRKERERVRLDKMNYAKLSEAAIVGGPGCVKGIQRWSSPAPLSPLPARGWEPSDPRAGK